MRSASFLLLAILTGLAGAAEVPGTAHSESRTLLSGGDFEGAIAALDAILGAGKNAEALALRGEAHELAGKASDAWQDFHDAATLMRMEPAGENELMVAVLAGAARNNGLRTGLAAAQGEAIAALEETLVTAKVAGDWQIARRAATTILRFDPLHKGAQAFLVEYWSEPSLRGHWVHFFDPSMRSSEKPEGVWMPLQDREGFDLRPNDGVLDTAELLLPGIDAPQDNYQIEATFEVKELNTSKERTLALGWGRGDGCTLVLARFADSVIGIYRQKGSEFTEIGDNEIVALPNEDRAFTLLLTVQGGDMTVSLDGEVVQTREEIASELSGLPFLLNCQNIRTHVWDLRFRYRPADGTTPGKSELKDAAKAIKKADPGCLDDVDAMLADSPNDVSLLLMRAQAAEALENKSAVMDYRRVLDEPAADKKTVKAAQKALKKLAAPDTIADILKAYGKAARKAEREAPRGFAAAELRVLEAHARVLPQDKASAKAWAKIEGDEEAGGEWTTLPLDDGEVCTAEKGGWDMAGDAVEGDASSKNMGVLRVPCVVSDAFDLSFDVKMLNRGRELSGFRVGLGEPLLLWTHGYPTMVVGLATGKDINRHLHSAKQRRDVDNEWHRCTITVENAFTSLSIDDELYFRAAMPPEHENISGRELSLWIGSGPIQFKNLRYRDRW